MRSRVGFGKELFAKQFVVLITIVVAAYAIVGVFVPTWKDTWEKVLVGLLVVLLFLLCRSVQVGYTLYLSGIRPLRVLLVHEGTSMYKNRAIVTLETRPWLKEGNLLLLQVHTKYGYEELAIIKVLSFTSAQYAEAEIIVGVQAKSDIEQFIKDSSRWKSLRASPVISPISVSNGEEEP